MLTTGLLENARCIAKDKGHDVSRVSIGIYNGELKIADDQGAYVWWGTRGEIWGHPTRAAEAVRDWALILETITDPDELAELLA